MLDFVNEVYTVLVLAGNPQVGRRNSVGSVWTRRELLGSADNIYTSSCPQATPRSVDRVVKGVH